MSGRGKPGQGAVPRAQRFGNLRVLPPSRLHIEEGPDHDTHHIVQKTVRLHVKAEAVPVPIHMRRAHGPDAVLHPASRGAEGGKVMGTQKQRGGIVHTRFIQLPHAVQRIPAVKRLPRHAVPDIIPVPLSLGHVAGMKIRRYLPAFVHRNIGG